MKKFYECIRIAMRNTKLFFVISRLCFFLGGFKRCKAQRDLRKVPRVRDALQMFQILPVHFDSVLPLHPPCTQHLA